MTIVGRPGISYRAGIPWKDGFLWRHAGQGEPCGPQTWEVGARGIFAEAENEVPMGREGSDA